jgi:spore coat protein U-like protein
MRVGIVLQVAAGLLLFAVPASAGCQVSLDTVAFGVVELDRSTTGTGKVAIVCDAAATLAIDIAGSASRRRMKGPGGAELVYELYQDAGHAVRWGDGSGKGATRSAAVDPSKSEKLTIYGVVPRQPGIPPGEYTDQIQVTLRF